jgi:hypothetical protein
MLINFTWEFQIKGQEARGAEKSLLVKKKTKGRKN